MLRALALLAVLAGSAAAEPRTAQLEYIGNCSAEQLSGRVRELAGRDPFAGDGATSLRVDVARTGERIHGTIGFAEGGEPLGQRELDAASCEAFADAAALVIVMFLARPVPAPPAPPLLPPPPATVRASTPPPIPSPVRAHRELGAILGAAGTTYADLAGFAGVRGRIGRLSLGLELAVLSQASIDASDGMVHVSRAEAGLVPCVHRGRVAACASLVGGRVRARGEGFVMNAEARLPVALIGGRLAWEQPIGAHLALRAHLEGRIAVISQRFLVDDRVVWASRRGELWAGLGVAATFP